MKKKRVTIYGIIALIMFVIIVFFAIKKTEEKISFFFAEGQETVEYEGIFYPLSFNEIRQNIKLNIRKVKEFKDGTLWALELGQLDVSDPEDEISMGRQELGYYYVTGDRIYQKRLRDMSSESDKKVTYMIQEAPQEFYEGCTLVCNEEGTENIADEQGWHEYVEVDGEKRIFHRYNDYTSGTKEYGKIVWERGKGITYYLSGAGSRLMEVEIGIDLYKNKQDEISD